VLVEALVARKQIVAANDGGVAPGVAAADPALLDHGDVRDPMLPGEIIRGRQAVAATADDDDVVVLLRLGLQGWVWENPSQAFFSESGL
jgi:hypothetical protein